MGAEFRRDVNLAMAYMLVEIDRLAQQRIAENNDLVQTVGVINSDREYNEANPLIYQNGITKISGAGYFILDIRSRLTGFRQNYSKEVLTLIERIAKDFRVAVDIEMITAGAAIESLDQAIQKHLHSACSKLGYSNISMPSGAGHDAGILAKQKRTDGQSVPVGMIFIPCRAGKSHSPDEFTTFESITKGANVLAAALAQMAG